MRGEWEQKLAIFLKRRKGEETFASFARKLGIPQSTLHRLLHKQQSPTFEKVQEILDRIKCTYKDVFEIELPSPSLKEGSKTVVPPSPTGAKYPKSKRKSG